MLAALVSTASESLINLGINDIKEAKSQYNCFGRLYNNNHFALFILQDQTDKSLVYLESIVEAIDDNGDPLENS